MIHPIVKKDIENILVGIKKESKKLEGKTILITGSSGFLGSYFMAVFSELNRSCFKKKCKVIALDNYITGEKKNILGLSYDKKFIIKQCDVKSMPKIKEPVDYIIHAAGIASPVYYMKYPIETIEVGTKGTQNLLELAREKKVKSFLFFSSSEIYGDPQEGNVPTPETYKGHVSSIGPRACYDESKRLGETLCTVYHSLYKVPVKIVRPFNVYGPGMKANDYRVLPRFLVSAIKREPMPIHGNGLQTRTYSYISDSIVGFLKVLLSDDGGEVYNIGNDQDEINLLDLAKLIVKKVPGSQVVNIPYPDSYPADEPKRRCPDITKAKAKLSYNPKVDISDGVGRLLQWYRDTYFNSENVSKKT